MFVKFLLHVADFFKKSKSQSIKVSQSYVYEIIKPAVPILEILKRVNQEDTQSRKFEKSLSLRVYVLDGEAYWIKDNAVYVASMPNDQSIDKTSAKKLDIINMDDVQLKKIAFIIEKLTEGLEE